jgi:hypothetical protein
MGIIIPVKVTHSDNVREKRFSLVFENVKLEEVV